MTIALARDVEAFLQEQVRAGTCTDPSELVNDVLRSLSQQHKPFKVTPELEAWVVEAADKPATTLTEKDFAAIRKRVRKSDDFIADLEGQAQW
jgi:Arc/MetJ-type ribon-helix-helix transcriptional regulator